MGTLILVRWSESCSAADRAHPPSVLRAPSAHLLFVKMVGRFLPRLVGQRASSLPLSLVRTDILIGGETYPHLPPASRTPVLGLVRARSRQQPHAYLLHAATSPQIPPLTLVGLGTPCPPRLLRSGFQAVPQHSIQRICMFAVSTQRPPHDRTKRGAHPTPTPTPTRPVCPFCRSTSHQHAQHRAPCE